MNRRTVGGDSAAGVEGGDKPSGGGAQSIPATSGAGAAGQVAEVPPASEPARAPVGSSLPTKPSGVTAATHSGRDLLSIGECLAEMSRRGDGAWHASIAGDAFNTLFYAARLGVRCGFVSAVGDDLFTPMIIDRIAAEGIDITQVHRLNGRRNGIYFIENDAWGERHFHYWRDGSAATETLIAHNQRRLGAYLSSARVVLITGVTLATLRRPDVLFEMLRDLGGETRIAFDPNYRASLWRGIADFRARCREILPMVDIYLPSRQDILSGWSGHSPEEHVLEVHAAGARTVVLKDGPNGAYFADAGVLHHVPGREAPHVVDTTGAGDAFNAGLLASLLRRENIESACRLGNSVAARSLMVQGAIDPAFSFVADR